jgi:ABC-type multidrug transport system fused ATPase/permease subunit
VFRLLRRPLRAHRGPLAVVVGLQTVQVVAALMLPTLNASVVDRGIVRGDLAWIRDVGLLMIVLAAVGLVAQCAAQHRCARIAMAVGHELRTSLIRHVGSLSERQVRRFGSASLSTRTVNDVQQIQKTLLAVLSGILTTPLMCLAGVVLALRQDVALTGLLLVLLPIATVLVTVMMLRMGPLYSRIQGTLDTAARVLGEQIAGVRVVRAFARDRAERARFRAVNDELHGLTLAVNRLGAMLFPAVVLLGNMFTVAIVWVGSGRIEAGVTGIGALTAFLGYLVLILTSVVIALYVLVGLPRARVAAGRVADVLHTAPELGLAGRARPITRRGHVALRGAGLRHPGAEEPSLRDVDLDVRPGETVAVVGSTGAGKSTLLSLVLRAADATAGTVALDGVDVRDLDPAVLTASVGLVPQRATLFRGTVASNLRFGAPDASDTELWEALEVVAARAFVARLPAGLDATVEQHGVNLSGGQRQRLAIARTLLRRPSVYLFDDCFSALDRVTEATVREALAPRLADAAVLLVAQRIDAVAHADRIVVLEQGRTVGVGTHHDLLADNPTYREIARSQTVPEEIGT